MAELKSQQTTAPVAENTDPCGVAGSLAALVEPATRDLTDSENNRPARGISIIPIPRREIARLQGTVRLSELPRRKPTIVFDSSRQTGDAPDE